MTSLQVKHGVLVKDKETAKKVLAYVIVNRRRNDFVLQSEEDFRILSNTVGMISSLAETARENAIAETENLEDPEYGLVKRNQSTVKG